MAPSRGPQPLARTLLTTLNDHRGPVHAVRYSKGSAAYVLSGGQDRTVRLWNPKLGTQIKAFEGHGYEVLAVSVSHDNANFASGGGDRTVFVWDVVSAKTKCRLSGHTSKVFAVEFNVDSSVLASGSYDATVRLWDLRSQNRAPIQVLNEAKDSVQALYISATTVIAGSVDGHVRTYDLRKGELRSDFVGEPVTSVQLAADGATVLVSTLDARVRLFDVPSGKLLNTFMGHAHKEYRCRACFGHAEASVVAGDEDGRVWAWDLVDAAVLPPNPPPKVHDKVITWVEHHPIDADKMITASADGTVKVWGDAQATTP